MRSCFVSQTAVGIGIGRALLQVITYIMEEYSDDTPVILGYILHGMIMQEFY